MSSKGRKKKSMTDEENVLYMEQKMILEAEAKKRKEDLLNQFLKDKLAKEEKSTKINLYKINYQWRSIMRDTKSKDLKRDIEILSQTFERIIDRKDSVIKSTVKDLQEAEEQYSMCFRSHIKNLDDMIDTQKEQLKKATFKYEEEVAIVKAEFDKEREYILKKHQHEMAQLQTIIYGMEKIFLDQENDAIADFQSAKEEIKNKNLEEKQQLRASLESKVEELWSQFNRVMKNYEETTEEKKRQFDELKEKDEKSAKEIDIQMRKIQRLSEQISNLKAKIAQNSKEGQDANNKIKEDRDAMGAHFYDLKNQMKYLQDMMRKKLTKLTLQTDETIKRLFESSQKGKQILQFAEMCRKLETEEEKVLPFYGSSLTEQEENDIKSASIEPVGQQLSEVVKDFMNIENFWKRFNKVYLDQLTLDKERKLLSNENTQLRLLLKQYLDGISVNDEVLTQVNPLFIINNRANIKSFINGKIINSESNKVVIEGAQHIKNTIF